MRKFLAAFAVLAMGASAVAGPHHGHGGGYGPRPYPPPPPPHHGGPHGGGSDSNEVASILSAYTGVLMLTSASMCASDAGCAYKEIIVDSKDDAALYIATEGDVKGVKLSRALELLREMDPATQSSDLELAEDIINF
ncbi:MAG: DUF2388 domain-containing protein [Bdellovibrio sp.]|nr:DUF2388 domain-containing protein [Bdellovibrio sp.]